VADPKNPGDRTRAHRLRRQLRDGKKLETTDALWLGEYEEKQRDPGPSKNFGASQSKSHRRISLDLDEGSESQAVGTGNAAASAVQLAANALATKEEGKRLDSLLMGAMDAMRASADINRQTALMLREDYGAIFQLLSERTEVLERTHIAMLQSVNKHYLDATAMEGQLMQQQQEGDPAKDLLTMLLAKHLGVPLPAGFAPPQLQPPRRPNGAKK